MGQREVQDQICVAKRLWSVQRIAFAGGRGLSVHSRSGNSPSEIRSDVRISNPPRPQRRRIRPEISLAMISVMPPSPTGSVKTLDVTHGLHRGLKLDHGLRPLKENNSRTRLQSANRRYVCSPHRKMWGG